jgi:hypothetical protein
MVEKYICNINKDDVKRIFEIVSKEVDYADSLHEHYKSTEWNEKIVDISFSIYGMENRELYVYGYWNDYESDLHLTMDTYNYKYIAEQMDKHKIILE